MLIYKYGNKKKYQGGNIMIKSMITDNYCERRIKEWREEKRKERDMENNHREACKDKTITIPDFINLVKSYQHFQDKNRLHLSRFYINFDMDKFVVDNFKKEESGKIYLNVSDDWDVYIDRRLPNQLNIVLKGEYYEVV